MSENSAPHASPGPRTRHPTSARNVARKDTGISYDLGAGKSPLRHEARARSQSRRRSKSPNVIAVSRPRGQRRARRRWRRGFLEIGSACAYGSPLLRAERTRVVGLQTSSAAELTPLIHSLESSEPAPDLDPLLRPPTRSPTNRGRPRKYWKYGELQKKSGGNIASSSSHPRGV